MIIADKSYRNRYKILRGGVINNFHIQNPTRQLEGQNTPASIITLINNSKASGSCCSSSTPIESIPIPEINIVPTILVYSTDQGSSVDWNGNIFTKNIELPNFSYSATITSIPASTVPDLTNLIAVTIGNTVTTIGNYSFEACPALTSITIPNSVISIGEFAFTTCTNVSSIIIGNSVTTIGAYSFAQCTSFTSIIIPNSVTSIGAYAFSSCSSLETITIGNSVISISVGTFEDCISLANVIFVPTSILTTISIHVFLYCIALTSITIPNSVTSIDISAFGSSSLENVYISSATATTLGITSPATGVSFFGRTVTTFLP